MFTEDAPSFEGRFYRINGAMNRPRPVQAGGPPILIGGSGERRTLRLVAEHADACNLFGDVATVRHKLESWPVTVTTWVAIPPPSRRRGSAPW